MALCIGRPLPNCTADDYITTVDAMSTCAYGQGDQDDNDEVMYRKSSANWRYVKGPDQLLRIQLCAQAAVSIDPSMEDPAIELPRPSFAACTCPQGMGFGSKSSTSCEYCAPGTSNNGTYRECQPCEDGTRSVEGRYYNNWQDLEIPEVVIEINDDDGNGNGDDDGDLDMVQMCGTNSMCTTCIGAACATDPVTNTRVGWDSTANYLSSGRGFGDIDNIFTLQTIDLLPGANIRINCSIDCRYHSIGGKTARSDVCSLKFKVMNSSGVTAEGLSFECGVDIDKPASRWSFSSEERSGTPVVKTLTVPADADGASSNGGGSGWTLIATFRQREEKLGGVSDFFPFFFN